MFVLNDIKQMLSNEVIIIFLIISWILIFRTSKQLKLKNYHQDYRIVKTTGIIYGILAVAAAIAVNI